MKIKHVVNLAAAVACFSGSLFGGTIVSDTFNNVGTDGGGSGWQAVTWTQTGTYTGVTIGANLITDVNNTADGVAYLLTALGPGATAGNVVGTFSIVVSGNPGINAMTTLFSGLTLGPGTYFLLVDPTAGGSDSLDWVIAGTPLQTLDSGVTQGHDLKLASTETSPTYQSATTATTDNASLLFSVTGTAQSGPGPGGAVPEPSSIALVALGLGGLMVLSLRWRVVR